MFHSVDPKGLSGFKESHPHEEPPVVVVHEPPPEYLPPPPEYSNPVHTPDELPEIAHYQVRQDICLRFDLFIQRISQDYHRPKEMYEHHHAEEPTALPPQFVEPGIFHDTFVGGVDPESAVPLPPSHIPSRPLIPGALSGGVQEDSFIGKLIDTPPTGLPHQLVRHCVFDSKAA